MLRGLRTGDREVSWRRRFWSEAVTRFSAPTATTGIATRRSGVSRQLRPQRAGW
jgi:hypothetical protein